MTTDIVKNIFVLLLPFIVYSTSYLVPTLYDIESKEYKNMKHSKLTLPPWVLFTVWCIIYIVMGASMVKVINHKKYLILYMYIIQIAFLISVIYLNYVFYKRSNKSGNIYLFYSIWSLYIFYLNMNLKIGIF